MTSLRRAVSAAMLVPLLLFAVSFAHDLMRCRVTGVVVQTCACPEDLQGPQGPQSPLLDAQSCCERQTVESLATGREETASSGRLPAPTLVALRTAPLPTPFTGRLPAALTAHRPTGPPLVLVKQSFLI